MRTSDELVGLMKTYAKMHVVENDVFSFTKSEYNQLEIVDTLSDDELKKSWRKFSLRCLKSKTSPKWLMSRCTNDY